MMEKITTMKTLQTMSNNKQSIMKKVLVFTIKAVLLLTVGIICKLLIAMFDDYNAAFKNGWH